MMVDYLSSQPDWAGYQVSTKKGSGPSAAAGELGLAITGASDAGDYTRIEADATAYIDRYPTCDNTGIFRDHAYRTLIDLPIVGFPTRLHVRLPRYRCTMTDCDVKYYQAQLTCAEAGKKVTHRVTRWIFQRLA